MPRSPRASRPRPPASPAKSGAVTIQIDPRALDKPDRVFAANWAQVYERPGEVQLAFGQQVGADTGTLTAQVVFSMTFAEAEEFLLTHDDDFKRSLDSHVDKSDPRSRISISRATVATAPPDRTLMERARLGTAAFLGDNAELGFYSLSPESYHRDRGRDRAVKNSAVRPIMTVMLATQLLHAVVERVQSVLES